MNPWVHSQDARGNYKPNCNNTEDYDKWEGCIKIPNFDTPLYLTDYFCFKMLVGFLGILVKFEDRDGSRS